MHRSSRTILVLHGKWLESGTRPFHILWIFINKPFNQRMGGMTDTICVYKSRKCIYNIHHPYRTSNRNWETYDHYRNILLFFTCGNSRKVKGVYFLFYFCSYELLWSCFNCHRLPADFFLLTFVTSPEQLDQFQRNLAAQNVLEWRMTKQEQDRGLFKVITGSRRGFKVHQE